MQYEIEQAWKLGRGLVGIYIHNLANSVGEQAEKGHNPFDDFCIDKTFNYIVHNSKPADANEIRLSSICTAYNPDWYRGCYNNSQPLSEVRRYHLMKRIFDSREFRHYQISSLYESRGAISSGTMYASYTTVFLSHKHDDLDDLKDVIGFLQTQYGVKVYSLVF